MFFLRTGPTEVYVVVAGFWEGIRFVDHYPFGVDTGDGVLSLIFDGLLDGNRLCTFLLVTNDPHICSILVAQIAALGKDAELFFAPRVFRQSYLPECWPAPQNFSREAADERVRSVASAALDILNTR